MATFFTGTAARLSIGCVGTSAGGRTGCVAPPLAAPWFRPSELSWTLWLSADNCSAPPSHSAELVTAAPRAVTREPRPSTPFGSARAPQAQPGRRDGRMSGGRRKEEPSQPQLANGALKVSVWSKVLRSDAAWEDKDEFLDVIYWFRQIIAVVLGVIWGVLPLRGFLGIAGFCLINAGVLYLYFSNYLQIDEEEYGGTWELTKEGFMTSFALFMVIWIIFYTAIHYD